MRKKKGALVLAVLLLASTLGGCTGTSTQAGERDSAASYSSDTQPLQPSVSQDSQTQENVVYEIETQTMHWDYTQDDVVLYSYYYVYPVLKRTDGETDEVIQAFQEQVSEFINQRIIAVEEELTDLVDAYEEGYGNYPCVDEAKVNYTRTEGLIQLCWSIYTNSGGAHGYSYEDTRLFRLSDAAWITPLELGTEDMEQTVTDYILTRIRQEDMVNEYGYFENYEDVVSHWANTEVLYASASFSPQGMTVTFPTYNLASYAAGPQAFTIPAEVLRPVLTQEGLEALGWE